MQQVKDRARLVREYLEEKPQLSWFERLLWTVALGAPDNSFRIIWTGDSPYLLRVYLSRNLLGFGVYLHHFFRSDSDREVHNHPWRKAYSLILTRGYLEHRRDPLARQMVQVDVRPWTVNKVHCDDFHRVELTRGRCWTLFITFDRLAESDGNDWGFFDMESGKYTPWGQFEGRGTSEDTGG